jgi:carbohydrate-selective porin OprB
LLLAPPGTRALACAAGTACFLCAAPVFAQEATGAPTVLGTSDVSGVARVGRVHEAVRRSTQRHSLYQEIADLYGDYSRFKTRAQNETGLQWSLDATLLQQWGVPGGGSAALKFLGSLSLNYDLFADSILGAGSLQFLGFFNSYLTRQDGAEIQSNLGLITPINDWPVNQSQFTQLTYTQTLPGNRVSISVGQYPAFNFDGNQYLGNSQQNFLNYIFAQNGSATYAAAGLGAYAEWNATSAIKLAGGLQYPNSASIATLQTGRQGDQGWFAYAQWTPKLEGLGAAQHSFTWYESPATGLEPATRGWSLNAVQNVSDTWAVFGRANGALGFTTAIRGSYALGVAMKDPLRRSPTDQIGVAIGLSAAAGEPTNPSNARNEKILEAYWNWTFFGGLLITPDVQLTFDPALNPDRDSVWILSLRATLMF